MEKILNNLGIKNVIKNIKRRIYEIIEKANPGDKASNLFDWFIIWLILLSICFIIIESFDFKNEKILALLNIFEIVSVIIFTIEYLLRVWTADLANKKKSPFRSRFEYMVSFYGLIDFFAILPFYLPIFIAVDLRFIRILRLFRIFRLLKINRYSNSISLIKKVIKSNKEELLITIFSASILILFSSCIMYYVEKNAQPDQFGNILATVWWSVATLTTVGYGDIYPVTPLGKIISGVIAILGIGIIALPTGIISSGFITELTKAKKKKCPHCGKKIES